MDLQNVTRGLSLLLTPATDSWGALFKTVRLWFCCGLAYGLFAAGIALAKYPVQWDTGILLFLLIVLYGGLKAAAIGAALWALVAVSRTLHGRMKRSIRAKD